MKKAEKSFISSTMWSERIGFVAALTTINEIEKTKSYLKLISRGKYINKKWHMLSEKYNLKLEISGTESITSFKFPKNNQIFKTFISQEMLKYGYLASNLIYLSTAHSFKEINEYIKKLEIVFSKISRFGISKIKNLIKGPISHSTFRRLNDKT